MDILLKRKKDNIENERNLHNNIDTRWRFIKEGVFGDFEDWNYVREKLNKKYGRVKRRIT